MVWKITDSPLVRVGLIGGGAETGEMRELEPLPGEVLHEVGDAGQRRPRGHAHRARRHPHGSTLHPTGCRITFAIPYLSCKKRRVDRCHHGYEAGN